MIVSYSRNFIFIKTKKTAGSTVEAVLATACARSDIVTYPSIKYVGMDPAKLGPEFTSEAQDDEEVESKRRGKKRGDFFNHMTAEEAYPRIDPAFWNSALKLTVERHPYEKVVSQAYFRANRKLRNVVDFPAHLDKIVRTGDYVGFHRWSIGGKRVVDEFIRQEQLQEDMTRIGQRLGINIPGELPRMKSRTRVDRRPANEILTDEQKQIIFERCREEFEILGYER
jgi:hypothetical protein